METMKVTARVPMDVNYIPSWLTWVGSTTTCLRALGVDCDGVDVAGLSGYAFTMSVHHELCPSGPTMCVESALNTGIHFLGRSTLMFGSGDCHTKDRADERTREHCRAAFDVAAREVAAGRPCVLWGAYISEFAVVTGVDEGKYTVKSVCGQMGQAEPPIPFDGLEAPGGPYVLAFPTQVAIEDARTRGDNYAVALAVSLLGRRSVFSGYSFGLQAYDAWIRALEAGRVISFGNAYNSQCYAERVRLAHQFVTRVAQRNAAAEPLKRAADSYGRAAIAMAKVTELFPFPPNDEDKDASRRESAVAALSEAKMAETDAVAAMAEALECSWEQEQPAASR